MSTENKAAKITESIRKAREKNVSDESILAEVKKQNPEKEMFFKKAEERGATATHILEEIIKQNAPEQSSSSFEKKSFDTHPSSPFPPSEAESSPFLNTGSDSSTVQKSKTSLFNPEKGKKLVFPITALAVLFFAATFLFFFLRAPLVAEISSEELAKFELKPAEIAEISEPAVVKIGYTLDGEATVPSFTIDFDTFKIKQNPVEEPATIPLHGIYWEGAGFVIDPDGFILTSAHTATTAALREEIFSHLLTYQLAEKFFELEMTGDQERMKAFLEVMKDLEEKSGSTEDMERRKENRETLFRGVSLDVEEKTVVFNPASDKTELAEAMEESFDFEVVSANESFSYDQKDIAIVKVQPDRLPAVPLGDSGETGPGDAAYTFSFSGKETDKKFVPHRAAPDTRVALDYFSPSFFSGNIIALRESRDQTFNLIEANLETTPEFSGSPVLNKKGEVIGITSSVPARKTGDGSLYAIPIDLVKEFEDVSFRFPPGDYYYHFKKGIYLMYQRHCRRALEEFDLARESVYDSSLVEENIALFAEHCEDLISQGKSIDTRWDAVKARLGL